MYLFYANDLGLRTCFENIIFFFVVFHWCRLLYSFICLLLFSPYQQQQQQQGNEWSSRFLTLELAFVRPCGEMRQRQHQHKLSQEFQTNTGICNHILDLSISNKRREREGEGEDKTRQRQATKQRDLKWLEENTLMCMTKRKTEYENGNRIRCKYNVIIIKIKIRWW